MRPHGAFHEGEAALHEVEANTKQTRKGMLLQPEHTHHMRAPRTNTSQKGAAPRANRANKDK